MLVSFAVFCPRPAQAQQRTTLLVGSEIGYPPYAVVTPDGKPDGFSVDLIKAVSKVMGMDIEFRVAAWNEVKEQLQRGEIDVLPHVYYSQDRDVVFDFSATHTSADGAFFVRSGELDDMTVEDVRGKSIIAMRSDWTHEYLVKQGVAGNAELADTVADALRHLAAGRGDVAFLPHLVGVLVAHELDLGNIETVGDVVPVGRGFAFAVGDGNDDLRLRLDEALAIVRATGRYDEIYEKWFGHLSPKSEQNLRLIKFILIGAGAIILLIGMWTLVLRRQVKSRTRELESIKAGLEQRVLERTTDLQQANQILEKEIAERKRMEGTLKASEERFGAFFENSPSAILIKDLEGRYLEANRLWHEWFNPRGTEIAGKTGFDFYSERYAQDVRELDRRVIATGTAQEVELDTPFADGKSRPTLLQEFPIYDAEGAITAIGGIATDIADRKSIEERLRQAQKMEAVGQLTGGVAHDFNNLLMVIMGNTELLQEQLGGDDYALNAIQRSTTRGAELTQRLLAFSRQQPLSPQAIELGELVRSMSGLLSRTLGETIEIETSAEPDLGRALADPGQVENALLNLALNARDAMPRGGKLTIECARAHLDSAYVDENPEAKVGDYVVLAVSDQGTGMSADVKAHAFEPFFTTKEVGQGSGLGLSMVYGFAKQSGGHVTIYSEEGRGTTIKLYLPQVRDATRREHPGRDEDVPRGGKEMILVIEDDPDVRELAVKMLKGLGYRVTDVPDAASAHEVLADGKRFDLALSDVVLPGGTSGLEFAEQIRQTHPTLKFIFMSGYPAQAAKRNGFLGSDKVLLNKPFQRQQLAKAVRGALGHDPAG